MNMIVACCCEVPFNCMTVDCVRIVGFMNVVGGVGTLGDVRLSSLSPCASSSYGDDGLGPYMDGTFPDHITSGDGCRWEFGVIAIPPPFPAGIRWYSISGGEKWVVRGVLEFTGGQWQLSIRFQGAVAANNGTAFWVRNATAEEGPYGDYTFDLALSTPGAFDNAGCPLNVPTLTIGPC